VSGGERMSGGMTERDIERAFTYQAPTPDHVDRLKIIRNEARAFAEKLQRLVPDGREKSVAITKLREVVMWANAGIVLEE
jgi:hypothetical protein